MLSSILFYLSTDLIAAWLGLLTVILMCVYARDIYQRRLETPLPPTPFGFPIVGHLPRLGSDPHIKMTEWRKKFGEIYRLKMGSQEAVVLNGLETIKKALQGQASDFAGRPDFYSLQKICDGKCLLSAGYDERFKFQRKTAIHFMRNFVNNSPNCPSEEKIREEANAMVTNMLNTDGNAVDPYNEIYLSHSSVIYRICFGDDKNGRDDNDFKELCKGSQNFVEFAKAGNPVDFFPWLRYFMGSFLRKFIEAADALPRLTQQKCDDHVKSFTKGVVRDGMDWLLTQAKAFEELHEKPKNTTATHVKLLINDILGAGIETVPSVMYWVWLYLIVRPDIQERARKEVLDVLGSEQSPKYADRTKMPYVNAVILEVMRKGEILPLGQPHSVTRDTVFNGYKIKKDSVAFINFRSVNTDETLWDKPSEFNPDRFLQVGEDGEIVIDETKRRNVLAFGTGKRKCVGELLARKELFIFLVITLQKLKIKKVENCNYSLTGLFGLCVKPNRYKVVVEPV